MGPLLISGRRQQCGYASVSPVFLLSGKNCRGVPPEGICSWPSWGNGRIHPFLLGLIQLQLEPPTWLENVSFDLNRKNHLKFASWWWVPQAFWVPRSTSAAWYHEGVKWGETLITSSSSLCL